MEKYFFVPWVRRHPLGYINKLWRIFGEEKKSGTNILYHQLFTMSNLIPDVIAKLRGYKVILHAHNNGLQKGGRMYLMAHNLGKTSFEILWFCDVHKFPVVLRLYVWEGC